MEDEKAIFRVELNEKGAESIRRIFPLVSIIFWSNLVVQLGTCYFFFRRAPIIRVLWQNRDSPYTIRLLVYPLYLLFLAASSILFFFYLHKFSRISKRGMKLKEGFTFNDSFSWLRKGLLFALISIAVNAAFLMISEFLLKY